MYLKRSIVFFIIMIFFILGCKKEVIKDTKKEIIKESIFVEDKKEPEKIKILVLPNASSYEVINHGYNFTDIIREHIEKDKGFLMIPFSYKKYKDVPHTGIYDKYYCKSIAAKTDADFIIMTVFLWNPYAKKKSDRSWGYGVKILNVKTMEQKESIRVENLKDYEAIKKHIRDHIDSFKKDIKDSYNE